MSCVSSLRFTHALSVVLLIGPEADRALCSQHSLGIVAAAAAAAVLLVVGVVCCAVVVAVAVAVVVVSGGVPATKPDIAPG